MIRIFNQYVSLKSIFKIVIEAVMILLSLLCAARVRFWNNSTEFSLYVVMPDFALQSSIVVVVCLLCFYCNELYDLNTAEGRLERILRTEQSLGAASLLLGGLYFLFPELLLSRGVFLIGMGLIAVTTIVSHTLLDKAWQATASMQHVAILGTGPLAIEMARELTRREDLNLKLEGFVGSADGVDRIYGHRVLGAASEMERIAARYGISRIIVALEDSRGVLPTRALVTLRIQGVRVEDASSALSALTGRVSLGSVKPSWFVFSDGFHRSKWSATLKRLFDICVGLVGLVLSAPIMAIVGIIVRLDSKGPVIYRQTRVGWMGRPFEVLKFRSMRTDAEREKGAQWATENDPRVTRAGRFLRKYRLDELPQFINVIRGDMSFVGPRPERPVFVTELKKGIPYYDERHSVRPGLTGWAQVQYSYGSSVEDALIKLEYDLFYLKNLSLTFDFAILVQTIRIVLKGSGGR